jgi:hypothetical protein
MAMVSTYSLYGEIKVESVREKVDRREMSTMAEIVQLIIRILLLIVIVIVIIVL